MHKRDINGRQKMAFVAHTRLMQHSCDQDLRPCHTSAAWSAHEKRMTFSNKTGMMVTKEINNTYKQRTLPNDERPLKGSNGHETDINGCQKTAFVPHT